MASVAAVLLAAGESTRMGESKALLPWRGQPLLRHQVQALHDAGFRPIIIVLGYHSDRLRQAVPSLPSTVVVENLRYRRGRSTSVVCGIEQVPANATGVLVLSVDQPRPASMLRRLREAFEESRPRLAVPAYKGRAGHPLLFSAALLPELLTVTESHQGMREVTSRHHEHRLLVDVDTPLALTDLNTHADYQAALRLAEAAQG